ncbi:MAG: hypothetical protein OXT09_10720 [Myxococcales bacterium]|nr:hypothetical protein [Myxococcales bacterium]
MRARTLLRVALLGLLAGCGDCAACGGCGESSAERELTKPPAEAAAEQPAEAPATPPDAGTGIPGLPPDASPLETAVYRAFHYFRSHELRGDQAWAVRQASALLGEPFAEQVEGLKLHVDVVERDNAESRMAALGKRVFPPPPALPTPPPPTARQKVDPALTQAQVMRVLQIMQRSIDCAQLDERERAKLLDDLRRPATGYLLSHQLWGVVTAQHLGCLEASLAEPMRKKLAEEVFAELSADDAWNDLAAERAALLAYAGLTDWIPQSLVALAITSQRDDGSWPKAELKVAKGVKLPEGHTVALGFYALAHKLAAERSAAR